MLRRVDWSVVTDTVEDSKSFIFTVSQSDLRLIPKDCGESSPTVLAESQISQHDSYCTLGSLTQWGTSCQKVRPLRRKRPQIMNNILLVG